MAVSDDSTASMTITEEASLVNGQSPCLLDLGGCIRGLCLGWRETCVSAEAFQVQDFIPDHR